nr:hypothetical protein [Bacteroidales bacterium]
MDRKVYLVFLLLLSLAISSCTYTFYPTDSAYPVPSKLHKLTTLSEEIIETSGLASRNETLMTFNDSGGEPALFEFDKQGSILNKTIIANTTNSDWEDIAYYGSNYYVADVGNNFGNRDTLVIYIIPSDLHSNGLNTSEVDSIRFSYDEQILTTKSGWNSHDCEAIFVYEDSIYLFAKDWVSKNTRIYVLPKVPGYYKIKSRVTYPVNALITGADIEPGRKEVVLIGYRNFIPIMIRYGFHSDPTEIDFGGKARKYPLHFGSQV